MSANDTMGDPAHAVGYLDPPFRIDIPTGDPAIGCRAFELGEGMLVVRYVVATGAVIDTSYAGKQNDGRRVGGAA